MLAKLQDVDPVMASRWHPRDERKIRRSLQIWLQTGRKASDLYAEQEERRRIVAFEPQQPDSVDDQNPPAEDECSNAEGDQEHYDEGQDKNGQAMNNNNNNNYGLRFPTLLLWPNCERSVLQSRLATRVDTMLSSGLVAEALSLDCHADALRNEIGRSIDTTSGIFAAIGYKEFRTLLDAKRAGTHDRIQLQHLAQEGVEATKAATRRYAKAQIRWIKVKLLNALREAKAEKSVVVLDTSDVSSWMANVLEPAVQCCSAFLAGQILPEPYTMSTKEQLVPPKEDLSRHRELWTRTTCEMCSVVAVTEDDWQRHIKSHRHRQALRKKMKRAQKFEHCASEKGLEEDSVGTDSSTLRFAYSNDSADGQLAEPTQGAPFS